MARSPDLIYEDKRSDKILKLKKFKDSECEVIAINKGNGKYKKYDGINWVCKDLNTGEIFKIGSGFSDETVKILLKPGEIITYNNFQNFNK